MLFKTLLTFTTILLCSMGIAQEQFEIELDSITSEAQANEFMELHKSINGRLITFNKEKHHSRLSDDLFELGIGGKKVYETELEKTYYKLIERTKVLHHRVSYIILDGEKKSLQEISTLRNDIISKYRQGVPFEDLAKRYSMDMNAKRGGDSGWFANGDMTPEFENQVANSHYKVGDIFTVDIPSKKRYYVVLKTYDNMMIEELNVLKIIEPISR
ncbi:MAG TPA: peptidylprolyl isomerase [Flavobacteriaceae bacterium]